jgi:ADP-ribosylglycohydrolase
VDAADAVARVEEWLRAVHGPELSGPEGVALRVDHDSVRRVPEGWSVPYNSVAYLDEGRIEKEIFPPPRLIVREPEGDLRQAHPQPGGLSIPVTWPGEQNWREIVDPEYTEAGLGHLGVPERVVAGWEEIGPDGERTGRERENPEYKTGPVRRGYPKPENQLEYVLIFESIGWLDRQRFLIGLLGCEVYVPVDATGRTARGYWNDATRELKVYTSTRQLPPDQHAWWRVDLATLTAVEPAPNLVFNQGTVLHKQVLGTDLVATLAEFPRFKPTVDEQGVHPEAAPELLRLAKDTANRLGLPEPVRPPLAAAVKARKRGYELTARECEKTVLGESWQARSRLPQPPRGRPKDLRANGLAPAYDNEGHVVPRVDTFGKYFPLDLPGYRFGWQRVTGAFVGFALGEALGSTVETLSLDEIRTEYGAGGFGGTEGPLRIGALTQRLLFLTEGVIRSPHREDPAAENRFASAIRYALLRWLHTQGVPMAQVDGWLVRVPELHARRDPAPAELAAIQALAGDGPAEGHSGPDALLAALPAALTAGGPGGLTGGSRRAAHEIAGLTHREEVDLDAAAYLAAVFERALTSDQFSYPLWDTSREVFVEGNPHQQSPVWTQLRAMVEESVPVFYEKGLPELRLPEWIGDGQGTLSVLGRAFAALAGYENYPEQALLRAVNHSGRSALTGALTGALLGARVGIPGLPREWVERLELRYLIENLASDAFWHFDRHSALGTLGDQWKQRYPRW